MNTMNNLLHEIRILETVLGKNHLSHVRRALYERKVNTLRKALRTTVTTIRTVRRLNK